MCYRDEQRCAHYYIYKVDPAEKFSLATQKKTHGLHDKVLGFKSPIKNIFVKFPIWYNENQRFNCGKAKLLTTQYFLLFEESVLQLVPPSNVELYASWNE